MEAARSKIESKLRDLEMTHEIKILYACESGSRAWGFESQDSDYDVRFLYIRPQQWYLSINLDSKRDVIEPSIDQLFDLSGWDLRKALQLYRKSNPSIYEWLFSPIVYSQFTDLVDALRQNAKMYYNPMAAHYHYLGMAKKNFESHLRKEKVKPKKYFYVLRPVLAVAWIERGLGVVPMEFSKLVEAIVEGEEIHKEIQELLQLKRSGSELDTIEPLRAIHHFLETEIQRHLDNKPTYPKPSHDIEELNVLFRNAFEKAWV